MTCTSFFRATVLTLGLLSAACVTGSAQGNINLEWRLRSSVCRGGHVFLLGLYAVSDSQVDQSIAAMDVIVAWDPARVTLLGKQDDGPYAWLFSGFPNDHSLDGLNDTWTDGDAFYSAYAQLGTPAYATPGGLLVTTFRFQTVGTSAFTTQVSIPASAGLYTHTAVYAADVPNHNVTGTLETETVQTQAAADMNCDGAIDGADIEPFFLGLSDPTAYLIAFPNCNIYNGDLTGNGAFDGADIEAFFNCLSQGNCGCTPPP